MRARVLWQVLLQMANTPEARGKIVQQGGFKALLSLCLCDDPTHGPKTRYTAAWALANLTSNPDNKMKILQLGALDRLRALHLSPSDEVQAASTKVLASLGEILTPSSRRAISSRKSHGTTPAAVGSSARRSSPLVAQGPDEEGMGASSRLASDLGSFKS